MANQVVMPKLSPTMEEGQLSRWLKKEGDTVSMGEPIAEIDTDKATMEMQALGNGVLRKILIQEGQSAPLGQVIAIIGEADEDISALLQSAPPAKEQKTEVAAEQTPEAAADQEAKPQEQKSSPPVKDDGQSTVAPDKDESNGQQTQPAGGRVVVSPIAARMATESGVNLSSMAGSGPGGGYQARRESAIAAG